MSIRLAVFDCDGTLVDGQAAVCTAMECAFAENALPAPDRHDVRRIVGLSLPQAIRLLAPFAESETQANIVEAYKSAFRQARLEGSLREPLFDGIEALLRDLHKTGWVLGVATGKSDRGLKSCLATHGLSDLFTTLQTADRHPSKPNPEMLEAAMAEGFALAPDTVMVGDTVYDIEMAKAIGVRAIGVSWGYHEEAELLAAGAVAVAQNATELGELIRG
ncbi:HAD-IA family hydrolase [Altererythrobacter indicus]|uniref:HAD-IA family hydrolase n=1 Tax=Altericroceibacterium indicum TaxID=374177 RepID=A0A845A7S8_9SPHN|nr:HAD-IA family hydrolase [Altericroceibacterium indicum]MXP25744.1 HAD-IA family hydrolase [Altericroceibacterium indicum]